RKRGVIQDLERVVAFAAEQLHACIEAAGAFDLNRGGRGVAFREIVGVERDIGQSGGRVDRRQVDRLRSNASADNQTAKAVEAGCLHPAIAADASDSVAAGQTIVDR